MTGQTGNNKPNEAEGLAFPISGNEKLIEEAAKAMADGEHNVLGWRGHSEDEREWYRKDAAIALAVFEKALTPTDDEREAVRLRAALEDVWSTIQRDVRVLANLDPGELGGIVARALEPDEYGHLPAEPQGEPSDAQEAVRRLKESGVGAFMILAAVTKVYGMETKP